MVPLCVSMAFSCLELTHKGPSLSTHELRLHQVLGAHQGQLWGEASSSKGHSQRGWGTQAGPGGAQGSRLDPERVQSSQGESPGLRLRGGQPQAAGVWEVVHAQHPKSAAPSCTWRDSWAWQTPVPPTSSPSARQLPLTRHPPRDSSQSISKRPRGDPT